ncbi:hypothetical protein MAMC_01781 [Methylacidimicrobium cyclopophantes]|uniref:UPF0056 membrane protein n=1 Tax=Methylacidimicrobium cyclopophantes TaxID=1041766 RepID=A0A5E6MDP5_9BACT|nr:NAAT family transporter [Methylacidimicrobium cyclopophantes]VVM07679.1 hypothetical protein MAMC_01781 [Methylacidimicrobium cyclopophantes]
MDLFQFALLSLSSLFITVDPIAALPTFLALTAEGNLREKLLSARQACLLAAGILLFFALSGQVVLRFLGVTLPAFQIAGGLVLLSIAHDMLMAQRSAIQESGTERTPRAEEDDLAVSPLAIPILAGPGAISTSVLLAERAHRLAEKLVVFLAICLVLLLTYGLFRLAAKTGSALLGPKAFRMMTRLMGLLLAAFAVQFIVNGIRSALTEP